jgi:purine-binding chemotaxis protein CheW
MKNQQYLIFQLHSFQYGIEAALVLEIFPLPELSLISEAPTDMMGLLNLRGEIVPVIQIDLFQKQLLKRCNISDYLIVLQWNNSRVCLVANQVNEVLEVNQELIEIQLHHELLGNINSEFIIGIAKVDAGNIVLLDPKTLIRQSDTVLTFIWDAQIQLDIRTASSISNVEQQLEQEVSQPIEELQTSEIIPSFYDLYCPDATSEERTIFRKRADNIRQSIESLKITNQLMPLAVIGFDNEYFGLDLELVQEFINVGNLTPIPCCPNHIVGNMNLRGEIVTLVDIRSVLNLPMKPVGVGSPVVVVQVDDIVAGLSVDRVLEMIELNSTDMTALPETVSDFGKHYLRGTALVQDKILKILDLPKIFTKGNLAVNEEV